MKCQDQMTHKREEEMTTGKTSGITGSGMKRIRGQEQTCDADKTGERCSHSHVEHTCAGGGEGIPRGEACNPQHSLSLSVTLPDSSSRWSFTATAAPFTHVEHGDATRASRHSDRALMLCWPPKEVGPPALQMVFLKAVRLCFVGPRKGRTSCLASHSPHPIAQTPACAKRHDSLAELGDMVAAPLCRLPKPGA